MWILGNDDSKAWCVAVNMKVTVAEANMARHWWNAPHASWWHRARGQRLAVGEHRTTVCGIHRWIDMRGIEPQTGRRLTAPGEPVEYIGMVGGGSATSDDDGSDSGGSGGDDGGDDGAGGPGGNGQASRHV